MMPIRTKVCNHHQYATVSLRTFTLTNVFLPRVVQQYAAVGKGVQQAALSCVRGPNCTSHHSRTFACTVKNSQGLKWRATKRQKATDILLHQTPATILHDAISPRVHHYIPPIIYTVFSGQLLYYPSLGQNEEWARDTRSRCFQKRAPSSRPQPTFLV